MSSKGSATDAAQLVNEGIEELVKQFPECDPSLFVPALADFGISIEKYMNKLMREQLLWVYAISSPEVQSKMDSNEVYIRLVFTPNKQLKKEMRSNALYKSLLRAKRKPFGLKLLEVNTGNSGEHLESTQSEVPRAEQQLGSKTKQAASAPK